MKDEIWHSDRVFDLDIAIRLAVASEIAYEGDTLILRWLDLNGFDQQSIFCNGNTQGFWGTSSDFSVLVFRGTDNYGHWLRNLRVSKIRHPWGRVHCGFAVGTRKANTEVQRFLSHAKKSKHCFVSGHSLGGAMAVLAGADLKMAGLESIIYTFGQPRVGGKAFNRRFSTELPDCLYRLVNQNDVVTRIPPGIDYGHCPQAKRIVANSAVLGLEAIGVDKPSDFSIREDELEGLSTREFEALQSEIAVNPLMAEPDLEGLSTYLSDHSITGYVELLQQIRTIASSDNGTS